jgi:hypothetical protein
MVNNYQDYLSSLSDIELLPLLKATQKEFAKNDEPIRKRQELARMIYGIENK